MTNAEVLRLFCGEDEGVEREKKTQNEEMLKMKTKQVEGPEERHN